jgi:hypothetical protein
MEYTNHIAMWHHRAKGREAGWDNPKAQRHAAGRYVMAVDQFNRSHSRGTRVPLDIAIVAWINGYDAAQAAYDPEFN